MLGFCRYIKHLFCAFFLFCALSLVPDFAFAVDIEDSTVIPIVNNAGSTYFNLKKSALVVSNSDLNAPIKFYSSEIAPPTERVYSDGLPLWMPVWCWNGSAWNAPGDIQEFMYNPNNCSPYASGLIIPNANAVLNSSNGNGTITLEIIDVTGMTAAQVNFDPNGGTGSTPGPIICTDRSCILPDANAYSRPGYTLYGWKLNDYPVDSFDGVIAEPGEDVSRYVVSEHNHLRIYPVTATAVWTENCNTITLQNTATSKTTIAQLTGVPGVYNNCTNMNALARVTAPTMANAVFAGYWLGDTQCTDETGVVLHDCNSVSDTTWTASWVCDGGYHMENGVCTPISGSLQFNANGGTGTAPQSPAVCNYESCIAPENTFTPPEGHVFGGWNYYNIDTGFGYTFEPGDNIGNIVFESGNTTPTLKAQWKLIAVYCESGTYLQAGGTTTADCVTCPADAVYCPGGNYTYDAANDQGISGCEAGYTYNKDAGKTLAHQCEIQCAAGKRVANPGEGCTTPPGNWYKGIADVVKYGDVSEVGYCMEGYTISGTSALVHRTYTTCRKSIAAGQCANGAATGTRYIKVESSGIRHIASGEFMPVTAVSEISAAQSAVTSSYTILKGVAASTDGDMLTDPGNATDGIVDADFMNAAVADGYLMWQSRSTLGIGQIVIYLLYGYVYSDLKISISKDGNTWQTVFQIDELIPGAPDAGMQIVVSSNPTTCHAGYYFAGGTVSLGSAAQALCATGSYSNAGASSCIACQNGLTTKAKGQSSCNTSCTNNAGVASWNTATWKANAVTDACSINTCNAGYVLVDNACLPVHKLTLDSGRFNEVLQDEEYYFIYNHIRNEDSCVYYTDSSLTDCALTNENTFHVPATGGTSYNFAGWWTEQDGAGTQYDSDSLYASIDDDVTLYAHYTPIDGSLQFNENGGTGTAPQSPAVCNYENCIAPENTFTPPVGYKFKNWSYYHDDTGFTSFFAPGENAGVTISHAIREPVLVAQWEPIEFEISYDVASDAHATIADAPYVVKCTYGRECYAATYRDVPITFDTGYKLSHWNWDDTEVSAEQDLSTITTTDGDVINLEAVTDVKEAVITYNVLGEVKTIRCELNQPCYLGCADPTKNCGTTDLLPAGYTFTEFYVVSDDLGDVLGKEKFSSVQNIQNLLHDSYPVNVAVEVDIRYVPNVCKVTLVAQSSYEIDREYYYAYQQMSDDMCLYYFDEELTRCAIRFGSNEDDFAEVWKPGYGTEGWYTGENGTGTRYTSAEVWRTVPQKFLTLYPNFVPISGSLQFNANGGTGTAPQSPAVCNYENCIAPENTFTPPVGYKFKNWSHYNDGVGTTSFFAPGENAGVTISHAIREPILVAQWEPIVYTVTFNSNGGTGNMTNQSRKYNDDVSLTLNTFRRSGYIFVGWNASADGTGVAYADGAIENLTTTNNAIVNLYAQWSQCPDGTYVADNACVPCEKGYSCSGGIKNECAGGTYADETGLAECKACPTANNQYGALAFFIGGTWKEVELYDSIDTCGAMYYYSPEYLLPLFGDLSGLISSDYTPNSESNKKGSGIVFCEYDSNAKQYTTDCLGYALVCGGGHYSNQQFKDEQNLDAEDLLFTTNTLEEFIDSYCIPAGRGYWSPELENTDPETVSEEELIAVRKRHACPTGLTTIGYGAGADESGDCGRVLHVDGQDLYLRSTEKTDVSLHVKVDGVTYFGNMAVGDKKMSAEATKTLKVKHKGQIYSVYDDSVI